MDIKIRVWDRHANRYIPLQHYQEMGAVCIENDGTLTLGKDYRFLVNMMLVKDEFTPELYINLNDKYDREIYFNDIVRITATDDFGKVLGEQVSLVGFDNGAFNFALSNAYLGVSVSGLCSRYGTQRLTFEVLGNIHQNPEIIEKSVQEWEEELERRQAKGVVSNG